MTPDLDTIRKLLVARATLASAQRGMSEGEHRFTPEARRGAENAIAMVSGVVMGLSWSVAEPTGNREIDEWVAEAVRALDLNLGMSFRTIETVHQDRIERTLASVLSERN